MDDRFSNAEAGGGSTEIPRDDAKNSTSAPLRWYTAAQVAEATGEGVEWVVDKLVPAGALISVAAKIKVGKTRFVLAMVHAVLTGSAFLRRATRVSSVVYLSEEGMASVRDALARTGNLHTDNLHMTFRHDAMGHEWPEIVEEAVTKCLAVGAKLLVIDTLTPWAGLAGEEENSSGIAEEVMPPLRKAASEHRLAIIVIRHARKSGGSIHDSARGSSAFGGAVDVLYDLREGDRSQDHSRRVLDCVGRFDGLPDRLSLAIVDGQYVVVSGTEVREQAAEGVRNALRSAKGRRLTADEIHGALGGTGKAPKRLQNLLAALCDSGEVDRRDGFGPNRKSLGYALTEPEDAAADTEEDDATSL